MSERIQSIKDKQFLRKIICDEETCFQKLWKLVLYLYPLSSYPEQFLFLYVFVYSMKKTNFTQLREMKNCKQGSKHEKSFKTILHYFRFSGENGVEKVRYEWALSEKVFFLLNYSIAFNRSFTNQITLFLLFFNFHYIKCFISFA